MKQPKPRKHNPEWQDNTRAARQRTRYERMKAKAAELDYKSWAALVTAILNGDVEIRRKT